MRIISTSVAAAFLFASTLGAIAAPASTDTNTQETAAQAQPQKPMHKKAVHHKKKHPSAAMHHKKKHPKTAMHHKKMHHKTAMYHKKTLHKAKARPERTGSSTSTY